MTEILWHNARIYTGYEEIRNGAVFTDNGKIIKIYPDGRRLPKVKTSVELGGRRLVPGFIDSHIHGFGGFSLHSPSEENILALSEKLPRYGVTSFVAALSRASADKDELIGYVKAAAKARGKEKGAHILGIHLEGPFLSPAKKGGQSARGIIPVDLDFMEELHQAADGTILTMTVAPELENISVLAEYCRNRGIKLQAGHTGASYEQMQQAVKLGIRHVTHTFNAMTGLHHRNPGVVGAALENDDVSCELIADGYHVHPAVVRILFKCKPERKIVLVTDAQKYTKTEIGSYVENGVEYERRAYFCRKDDGTLVGTDISLFDAFRNLIKWGIPFSKALSASSSNPADVLNLPAKGFIKDGYDADFVILNDDLTLYKTIISGTEFS